MKSCENCGERLSDEAKACDCCAMASTKNNEIVISRKTIVIISAILVVLVSVGIVAGNIISTNIHKKNLKLAYENMIDGAAQAEAYVSLQSKVWKNCIDKKSSPETDKYTKDENGNFFPDFNDALSEFFTGQISDYSEISLNVTTVDEYMLKIWDHDKKFEDKYWALRDLYREYRQLTDLVVGSERYSLNTFNQALETAVWDYEGALSKAKLLFE